MVEESGNESVQRANRGVNARPVAIHSELLTDSESVSTTRTPNRSIIQVRNEIQTTLDLMGPSTPTLTHSYNPASDADNEESVTTVADQISSSISYPPSNFNARIRDDSVKADIATSSSCTDLDSVMVYDAPPIAVAQCAESKMPHLCMNPECMCMMGYMTQTSIPVVPERICNQVSTKSARSECKSGAKSVRNKQGLINWLKERSYEMLMKRHECGNNRQACELYRFNTKRNRNDEGPPRRLVFDLVEGIPTAKNSSVSTIKVKSPIDKRKSNFTGKSHSKKSATFKEPHEVEAIIKDTNYENLAENYKPEAQKYEHFDSNGDTRVDFYYFDHGNAQYFHTTDTPPIMMCEILAEKTERYTTRFWAEFFTTIHIAVAFVVSFILQLFKFLLYSILRPLTVGLMQLGSDYFFKPFLTTFFNGVVQPILIFFYNVVTSLRDLCDPIAEAVGYFCRELAVLCRSIRLFSVTKCGSKTSNCKCGNKNKCGC